LKTNKLKIMNRMTFKFGIAVVIALFSLTSCSKSSNYSLTATSDDNSTAESLFDDVFESSMEEVMDMDAFTASRSLRALGRGDCGEVTDSIVDSTTHHVIRTIDFGTDGCTYTRGDKEITKKGKIIIEKIGKRHEDGFSLNVNFDGFSVNDYAIEGSKTVSNAVNDADQLVFTIAVTSTITNPEGNSMTWTSNRTRTLIEGYDTEDTLGDDVMQIEGSNAGTNFEGESFSSAITTPLIKSRACNYITEGVIEITPAGKSVRTIDYGVRTDCDNLATVTVDEESKEIEIGSLRKKRRKMRRGMR
jgi:hypothetical protein